MWDKVGGGVCAMRRGEEREGSVPNRPVRTPGPWRPIVPSTASVFCKDRRTIG